MTHASNPFAVLIDPTGVLSACAATGRLDSLPVSARHSADRSRFAADDELALHDAAVDQIYAAAIEKASKPAPVARVKTKA